MFGFSAFIAIGSMVAMGCAVVFDGCCRCYIGEKDDQVAVELAMHMPCPVIQIDLVLESC